MRWTTRARRRGRDRWIGPGLTAVALTLVTAAPACESEEPTDIVSYTDSAGRSCTVDRADITEVATCDADPATLVTCEAGQEPVIVVHSSHDFETDVTTLQSCGACIDRAARMTFVASTTCANVDCALDMDCVYDVYTCTGGVCQR